MRGRRPARGAVTPVLKSVEPSAQTPEEIRREFRELTDDGARIQCVGTAKRNPERLLSLGYVPRYKVELFGAAYYVCDVRKNVDLRFVIAYISLSSSRPLVFARLLYKDGSLIWRSASHFARSARENWIGKGDLKLVKEPGGEFYYSAEHTTDLPLEIQTAMESINLRRHRTRVDRRAVALVLRRGSDTRLIAYRDFIDPRRRAARDRRNLVNGGRPIARFRKDNDPASLEFVKGYEPDFSASGMIDVSSSESRLYGGRVERYRVCSRNRKVQYLFFASPRVAWVGHPQAFTTELSSYGVRTVDVHVPDDLVVPGIEYHYLESDDPPVWVSQIPPGFVGEISPVDPWRAGASAWTERLPVIVEFRRRVLNKREARVAQGSSPG